MPPTEVAHFPQQRHAGIHPLRLRTNADGTEDPSARPHTLGAVPRAVDHVPTPPGAVPPGRCTDTVGTMTGKGIDALGQLHHEHLGRRRDLRAEQYVYEIGSYHYNWHRDFELLVVLTGEVEVCAGGTFSVLVAGDVVLVNSNEGHATLPRVPHSTVLLLHLDPDYVASFDRHGVLPSFDCRSTALTRHTGPFQALRRRLASMMLASLDTTPAGLASYERDLADVVAILYRSFPSEPGTHPTGEGDSRDAAIGRVTTFIDRHYRDRITLAQLAHQAGYSSAYLSEILSQQLGMTASEYMTRVRLAHAVRDLADENLRIGEIASDNGFPDVKALGVAFRRAFGKTPSQYRSLLRELGTQIADIDAGFHETFVSRNDPTISPILSEMAGRMDDPVTAAPVLDPGITSELEDLAAVAGAISDRLRQLTGSGQTDPGRSTQD